MKKLHLWIAGGAALCVVLVAAGWLLVISPGRKNVASTRAQTADLVTQSAQLQSRLDQLRSEQSQIPAKLAALSAVATKIPPTSELSTFIRQLHAMATENHVTVSTITPSAPHAATATGSATSAAVSTTQITLAVAGTYADIEEFLNSLENAQRLITVQSFTLTPGGKAVVSSDTPLTVTFTAAIYETDSGVTTPPVNLPSAAASVPAGQSS